MKIFPCETAGLGTVFASACASKKIRSTKHKAVYATTFSGWMQLSAHRCIGAWGSVKVLDETEAENLDRWKPRFVLSVRPLESALEQFRAAAEIQLLLDA